MYELYIANKNYSSWSLRPWILMKTVGIPFVEKLIPFGSKATPFSDFSPTGKVPCLVSGDTVVWDSLAIVEFLAEQHPGVWAADPQVRAWSRSASAEMHSGFFALRDLFTMNVGLRIQPKPYSEGLKRDLARIEAIWFEGLARSGGPFLAGAHFTAVDAFYCPVAFRFMTYTPDLGPEARSYAERLCSLPYMQEWYRAALKETWRDEGHDAEARAAGKWLADLRASA